MAEEIDSSKATEDINKVPDILKLDYKSMIDEGWKPYVRTNVNKMGDEFKYITLKKGKSEKSLGTYSDESYDLIMKYYNEANEEKIQRELGVDFAFDKDGTPTKDIKKANTEKSSIGFQFVKTQMIQPIVVPKSIVLDLQVLNYYNWAVQNKQYGYDLGRFMNEATILFCEIILKAEPVIYLNVDKNEKVEDESEKEVVENVPAG